MGNDDGCAYGDAEQGDDSWVAGEIAGCEFTDARLGKRLGNLLHQISGSIGGTVPLACQDWANTKAAYRFFSNEHVDEGVILAGHFQATRERAQVSSGPLLVLQDTTEFSYKRDKPELVGFTGETISRKDEAGRWRKHKVCALMATQTPPPMATSNSPTLTVLR